MESSAKKAIAFDYIGTLVDYTGTPDDSLDWATLIDDLRNNGHMICVVTSDNGNDWSLYSKSNWWRCYNSHLRTLHVDVEKEPVFFGTAKYNKNYYDTLARNLNTNVSDITLIDRSRMHIQAAQRAGANGILFKGSVEDVRKALVDLALIPA